MVDLCIKSSVITVERGEGPGRSWIMGGEVKEGFIEEGTIQLSHKEE